MVSMEICTIFDFLWSSLLRNLYGAIGVDDGARTHDRRDHNPELYQLSYAHH